MSDYEGLPTVLRSINGHTLVLCETDWQCLHCGHWFDAASDADGWVCGEPCVHRRAAS